MLKKKTHEEFVKEIFDIVGDEYKVLGRYELNNTKIKMKHTTCGNEYDVTPSNFITGKRCPICAKKSRTKTTEQFKKEVLCAVGNTYEVCGEYKLHNKKIEIKHTKCDNIYKVTPNNILAGNRCPICAIKNATKDTEQFKKEVFDAVGDEYEVLKKYELANIKIKMKHTTCGNEYDVTPNSFLLGCRCPICYIKNATKTTEQFKKEVFDAVGDEYEVLEKYELANIKIKMKHTTCGNEYAVTPNNFLLGCRCPICSQSKGELKTFQILTSILNPNKYNFNNHYLIPDCRDKSPLPFDNFINQDKTLLVLIEYDGIQHYEPVRWTNSITKEQALNNLKEVQRRDKIKNDYCKKHSIPLIRIKYTEYDNIEGILLRELTELGIINKVEDMGKVA